LNLTVPRDEIVYMVVGRAISAGIGTAAILVAYVIGARLSGRLGGLLSAFFLACAGLHLRDSHFATTDISMAFFCTCTLWYAMRLAERGDTGSLIGAGIGFGGAILCKYSGGFV